MSVETFWPFLIISDYAVMPRSCLPHAVLNLVTAKEGEDVPRVAAL